MRRIFGLVFWASRPEVNVENWWGWQRLQRLNTTKSAKSTHVLQLMARCFLQVELSWFTGRIFDIFISQITQISHSSDIRIFVSRMAKCPCDVPHAKGRSFLPGCRVAFCPSCMASYIQLDESDGAFFLEALAGLDLPSSLCIRPRCRHLWVSRLSRKKLSLWSIRWSEGMLLIAER